MTVIVAVRDEDNVYLGADHQVTFGQLIKENKEPKFFSKKINVVDDYGKKIGDTCITFALTGYMFLREYLKYNFSMPDMNGNIKNILEYLIPTFVLLSHSFKEDNLITIDDNKADSDSAFIIVYGNQIFGVNSSFSIFTIDDDYFTHGSGYEVAIGSLHTSKNLGWSPEKRIKVAIRACADHTIYVKGPVDIIKISKNNGIEWEKTV